MTKKGREISSTGSILHKPVRGWLPALVVILFLAPGCETTSGLSGGTATGKVKSQKQDQGAKTSPDQEVSRAQSSKKDLEMQVRSLEDQLRGERVARESLQRRLEIAQAAREDAIREVVRVRARIQGMASQAEASAMFAEARVIMDRMEAEAFSDEALDQLQLAKSYMDRGKNALDSGNPGGGAYLFDLIPGLYEGMKKGDPRLVEVKVSVASLRESPAPSSLKLESLPMGEQVSGVDKNDGWIKVKTSSGKTGWLMKTQVH
jgi:hypothetical protein